MSAFGPKQTLLVAPHMSASGRKADLTCCGAKSPFRPERTLASQFSPRGNLIKKCFPNCFRLHRFKFKGRPPPTVILTLNRGVLHGGTPKISSLSRSQKRADSYWHHDGDRVYRAESNGCWGANTTSKCGRSASGRGHSIRRGAYFSNMSACLAEWQ
jgi:hypothetical protein